LNHSSPAVEDSLLIDLPKTAYGPGETVRGEVLWALGKEPEVVRLTLGWWTEGRGTKDAKIVAEKEWPATESAGRETFEFALPSSPYGFDGTLITLKWGLELTLKKGSTESLLEIAVGPGGRTPQLENVPDESPRKSFSFRYGR
jgi:hypothetical protein